MRSERRSYRQPEHGIPASTVEPIGTDTISESIADPAARIRSGLDDDPPRDARRRAASAADGGGDRAAARVVGPGEVRLPPEPGGDVPRVVALARKRSAERVPRRERRFRT